MPLFLASASQHMASWFATALAGSWEHPTLTLKCSLPEMALVTSARILLVTSRYMTMPDIKRCVDIPSAAGEKSWKY